MRDHVKRLMARTFGIAERQIPDDSGLNGLPEWDSLRHLQLMLALEMEFGVRISTEEMLELVSLEAIEAFVRGHGATVRP